MQHTIDEMYEKVCAMRDLAQIAHNEKYARPSQYDWQRVTHLVEQIQALAGDIYNDKELHPKVKAKQENLVWQQHDAPQTYLTETDCY